MTKASLEAKKQELTNNFNALNAKKLETGRVLEEINAELNRLQGEFRLVEALLKDFDVKPSEELPHVEEIEEVKKEEVKPE